MNQITRIKIDGFRRLAGVNLDLRPMLVMIGANGVGKSSVLEALSLLSASADGRLGKSLSNLGGISSVLTRGKADRLTAVVESPFALDSPLGNAGPLTYELTIVPNGNGFGIQHEQLSQESRQSGLPFIHLTTEHGIARYLDGHFLSQPTWDFDSSETALSQVPRMQFVPQDFRRLLSSTSLYHVLDIGPRAPIRLPQQMRPAVLPGANGEDLVSLLYSLRESDRDRFDAIIDALRAGFPTLEELAFPPVAAGTLAMTWKDRNFRHPLYMNELSEGTLRFLWLVSLLQGPTLPTITMIDEPEVSLHPELLSLLADLMREASKRTQLIVATHSDRFIRFLKPSEVVVLDSDEQGLTTATWADTLDLDRWLEDYSLDDVWRMGRIGGRA